MHQRPEEPKPPAPRGVGGSSSDLDGLDRRHGHDDELGDAHAGLDDEALVLIGVEQHDGHLAAVAGVHEAGRVDDGDPVPRGQAGARLHEPGVALRDGDGEAGADGRALARAELDPVAGGQVEPRVARVGPAGDGGLGAQAPHRQVDQRARPGAVGVRVGDEVGREAPQPRVG